MDFEKMSYDETADLICKIAEHVERISGNDEILNKITAVYDSKGFAQIGHMFALGKLIFSGEYREDMFAIIAATEGTDVESVRKRKGNTLMTSMLKSLGDLKDFFN